MKKVFSKLGFAIIMAVMLSLVLCFSANAVEEKGSCGKNVTYTYNSKTGEVVISGKGDMTDYDSNYENPFYSPFASLQIKSVVIEEGVTSIGDESFFGCSNLTNVSIADTVTKIGDYAFVFCYALEDIMIPDSVTDIGAGAFYDCRSLTTIVLPEGLTTIENDLFCFCENLIDIYIPDSVVVIGTQSFYKTPWYESLPKGMNYIGKVAYKYKGEMPRNKSIVIKKGTTEIAENCFSGCVNLVNITVPDSVKRVGRNAFSQTAWWDRQPNGIVFVGKIAYDYKGSGDKVTTISLPEGTVAITDYAFNKCVNLESIEIPISVKYIGISVFGYGEKLTDVYYGGPKKSWRRLDAVNNWNYCLKNATIHYQPCAHKNKKVVKKTSATCIKNGYTAGKYCKDCEEWISGHKKIVASGHVERIIPAVSATYTSNGFTEGKECSVCGMIIVKQKKVSKKKLSKVTVSSVKSSKKGTASVSWKQVKNSSGYIVEYSTSKKFTKKTTKTATAKKAKTTKTALKKLKSGKKYYVRIKAYKTVSGKKVYGSYSKVKTVKVK